MLPPGSVVGFFNAKVGLRTSGAALLGVVSDRAIIVGSKPGGREAQAPGVVVAYCGRVPVRVEGSCCSGDPLVPSERGDGVARALRVGDSCDGWQACDAGCAGMTLDTSVAQRRHSPSAAEVVAVATQDSDHSGVMLVDAVISPPAMTKRVVQNLHGTSRAQCARQGFKATLLGLLAVLLLAACYTTNLGWLRTDRPGEVGAAPGTRGNPPGPAAPGSVATAYSAEGPPGSMGLPTMSGQSFPHNLPHLSGIPKSRNPRMFPTRPPSPAPTHDRLHGNDSDVNDCGIPLLKCFGPNGSNRDTTACVSSRPPHRLRCTL